MSAGLILLAAGSGKRLPAEMPKAFISIRGFNLVQWCLKNLGPLRRDLEIVITVPNGFIEICEKSVMEITGTLDKIKVITGGATRQDSTGLALRNFPLRIKKILVHDVARAFTPHQIYWSVINQLNTSNAVIPAIDIIDSVKQKNSNDGIQHLDRGEYLRAQTPQGFDRTLLEKAYELSCSRGVQFTDESAMVSQIEKNISLVNGHEASFKITHPQHLQYAEFIASTL